MAGSYNIPLELFFTEYHPHWAPIGYVRPDRRIMRLMEGNSAVDKKGCIRGLRYLNDWNVSQSSVTELIKALREQFELEPPVYTIVPEKIKTELVAALNLRISQELRTIRSQVLGELQPIAKSTLSEVGLSKEQSSLQKQKCKLEEGIQLKSKRLSEVNDWMEQNFYLSQEVEPGMIMCPDNVQIAQILRSHADNDALQDGLALLHDAFERRVINLDTFVSEVRRLSKEQYKARALIRKIQKRSHSTEQRA
mmetsp:Transcript_17205/g.35751  ORF Transcript_17205/g.35751 Transcript_17205/m.35751 type:complete len:251 (-) Transcript_17205:206-958(-)